MSEQRTFASMAWSQKGKVTRRERFLAEMEAEIPWSRLLGLVEPHYPQATVGRPPHALETMLRISTKNATGQRDPEMKQTAQGQAVVLRDEAARRSR